MSLLNGLTLGLFGKPKHTHDFYALILSERTDENGEQVGGHYTYPIKLTCDQWILNSHLLTKEYIKTREDYKDVTRIIIFKVRTDAYLNWLLFDEHKFEVYQDYSYRTKPEVKNNARSKTRKPRRKVQR